MHSTPASEGFSYLERLASLEDRHQSLSFEEVRDLVFADDEQGWRIFVEKYSRFVYSVALRLLAGLIKGKEDVAQEIYCHVFAHLQGDDYRVLRQFQSRCKFTTYLFRMVQTARSTVLRREVRDSERTDYVDFSDEATRAIEAIAAEGESAAPDLPSISPDRLRGEIERAAESLSDREKLLLKLRFQKGLKLRELAETLGYRDTNDAAYALRKALGSLSLSEILDPGEWTDEDRRQAMEILNDVLFQ
jgi:RNA polymerase sigma factor (sigma-70 family)